MSEIIKINDFQPPPEPPTVPEVTIAALFNKHLSYKILPEYVKTDLGGRVAMGLQQLQEEGPNIDQLL